MEPTLRITVDTDDAHALGQDLRAALPTATVEVSGSDRPPRTVILGSDRVLNSSLAQVAIVAVTGSGFAGALAKVLVERIRATRRGVQIRTASGSSVYINGAFSAEEVESIVATALTQRVPPPNET